MQNILTRSDVESGVSEMASKILEAVKVKIALILLSSCFIFFFVFYLFQWEQKRLLWLAWVKNPNTPLGILPKTTIRHIASFVYDKFESPFAGKELIELTQMTSDLDTDRVKKVFDIIKNTATTDIFVSFHFLSVCPN